MTRALLLVAALVALTTAAAAAPSPTARFFDMVQMPAGFWVARCEVTQRQYQEIAGENPSAFPDPARPVDSVSWDEADAFCRKLTAREIAAGRLPAGWAYDLPTDAEWDQFAAGATTAGAVTSLESPRAATEPAGAAPPNALGLHDVIGNVWEWCRDWYSEAIRRKDANPDVPPGALLAGAPEEQIYKVLRGGAWDTAATDNFTPATRLRYAPGMSNYRTGFRCVLEPKSLRLKRQACGKAPLPTRPAAHRTTIWSGHSTQCAFQAGDDPLALSLDKSRSRKSVPLEAAASRWYARSRSPARRWLRVADDNRIKANPGEREGARPRRPEDGGGLERAERLPAFHRAG